MVKRWMIGFRLWKCVQKIKKAKFLQTPQFHFQLVTLHNSNLKLYSVYSLNIK